MKRPTHAKANSRWASTLSRRRVNVFVIVKVSIVPSGIVMTRQSRSDYARCCFTLNKIATKTPITTNQASLVQKSSHRTTHIQQDVLSNPKAYGPNNWKAGCALGATAAPHTHTYHGDFNENSNSHLFKGPSHTTHPDNHHLSHTVHSCNRTETYQPADNPAMYAQ